jgi:lipoprotein-anchoring transpeptidase ErfK/SrfK
MFYSRQRACFAPTILVVVITAGASGASAQYNWDSNIWGSGSYGRNSVSERRTVSFPKRYDGGQIIVSFGDRRLYHIVARGRAISYPIAVPRAQSRWKGVERVSRKRVNPTWTPTAEMRRENPKLPRVVKGGHPRNPLGTRAIYLGNTLYRIHGTDAPWTIGKNVSRGCIRMRNSHVEDLYNRVRRGMKVTATWAQFSTRTVAGSGSSSFNVLSLFDLN